MALVGYIDWVEAVMGMMTWKDQALRKAWKICGNGFAKRMRLGTIPASRRPPCLRRR